MNEEEATKLSSLEELQLAADNADAYVIDLLNQQEELDSKMRDAMQAQRITAVAYYEEWKRTLPCNNYEDTMLGTNDE